MHIISFNMSALLHCQMGDKQECNVNRDCSMVLQFATLPTGNCFCEHFSAIYTYIMLCTGYVQVTGNR